MMVLATTHSCNEITCQFIIVLLQAKAKAIIGTCVVGSGLPLLLIDSMTII
jgi:hypothetical protein